MKTTKSIGKKYGRLTVLKVVGKNKHKKLMVECVCSCGKKFETVLEYIQQGDTRSCGCLAQEKFRKLITKHRFSKTRFYWIYNAVVQRCNNPKTINYKIYGGRGIRCLWKDFVQFHREMHRSYLRHFAKHGKDTSIDRIDTNGNYCKENCRWATMKKQNRNTRSNRFLTLGKRTQTVSAWSEETGIAAGTITIRIDGLHWSVKEALGIVKHKQ